MLSDILTGIVAVISGYLIGSISFSRLVTQVVSPETDLKETLVPVEGTEDEIPMNAVSATSVRFQLGPRYGCLASFLDMIKVALPVGAFKYLFPGSQVEYLVAIAGLIGHNWPIYYKFEGGYGHSAIYGALMVLDWTALPVTFLGTGLFYFILRQVHLAAAGGVLLLIPWFLYRGLGGYALLFAAVSSAAYIIKIIPDFRSVKEINQQKSGSGADPENSNQN